MKTIIPCCLILCFFFIFNPTLLRAQKIPVNFGKVNPEDFNIKSSLIDSNTNAVIIADQGDVSFEGNDHGWFTYVFKRNCRILFLNTKAIDLATVKLYFHKDEENKQKLDKVSATTYNLQDGKVVQTKLNTDDIFEEKIDKNRSLKKFTLSAVKAGSIIEYSYTIKSDYIYFLPEWKFQSEYAPTLWSDYKVDIPGLLSYNSSSQSFQEYYINESGKGFKSFNIRRKKELGGYAGTSQESLIVSAPMTIHRWVKKDVPEFANEQFLFSPGNYVEKISFQLYDTYDGEAHHKVSDSWQTLAGELLKREDFGLEFNNNYGWLDDILKNIIHPNDNLMQQAKKIYYYVQQNYTCTDEDNFFIKTDLKDVVRKKSGTVGDINLLLLAILKKAGIVASPVVLSTTDYGRNSAENPRLDQLNYVIDRVELDNKNYMLDATIPFLPFGFLPAKCYNGSARMISENSAEIILEADSLNEIDQKNVIIINADKGIEGSYTNISGFYNSIKIRNHIVKDGIEDYKNQFKKSMPEDFKLYNIEIDSLRNNDQTIVQKMDFNIPSSMFIDNDIVYFNPVLTAALTKNPFAAAKRKFNVEMPYPITETYNFSMEIPKGYRVDELPKSVKVKLNDSEGVFIYSISVNDNTIRLFCKTILYKTKFITEDYETLRNFYSYKVKKEAEQIVFKKIK
ncbi:MAG: DUF3857 domain-containing protein [Ferruginibacter sp.]